MTKQICLPKQTGKRQDPLSEKEPSLCSTTIESKQVIPAHKFILAIGSPVFEAMFYGELAETKDTIQLPDCNYQSLLELFRYMYSDEVNLSGSNVMGAGYTWPRNTLCLHSLTNAQNI